MLAGHPRGAGWEPRRRREKMQRAGERGHGQGQPIGHRVRQDDATDHRLGGRAGGAVRSPRRAAGRTVVWISGPPGSGKTTLAASYVQARRVQSVWYQVDSDDADPASFFHYLSHAARKLAAGHARDLPPFTARQASDVASFCAQVFPTALRVGSDAGRARARQFAGQSRPTARCTRRSKPASRRYRKAPA